MIPPFYRFYNYWKAISSQSNLNTLCDYLEPMVRPPRIRALFLATRTIMNLLRGIGSFSFDSSILSFEIIQRSTLSSSPISLLYPPQMSISSSLMRHAAFWLLATLRSATGCHFMEGISQYSPLLICVLSSPSYPPKTNTFWLWQTEAKKLRKVGIWHLLNSNFLLWKILKLSLGGPPSRQQSFVMGMKITEKWSGNFFQELVPWSIFHFCREMLKRPIEDPPNQNQKQLSCSMSVESLQQLFLGGRVQSCSSISYFLAYSSGGVCRGKVYFSEAVVPPNCQAVLVMLLQLLLQNFISSLSGFPFYLQLSYFQQNSASISQKLGRSDSSNLNKSPINCAKLGEYIFSKTFK